MNFTNEIKGVWFKRFNQKFHSCLFRGPISFFRVTTSAEDTLITLMITQAREAIEVATGLSLISKTIVVWFTNWDGSFNLPFGPVNSFTSLIDQNGNTI